MKYKNRSNLKKKLFLNQSKSLRKYKYICLKNYIDSNNNDFELREKLSVDGKLHKNNTNYFDAFFLSKKYKDVFYNVTFLSLNTKLKEDIDLLAHHEEMRIKKESNGVGYIKDRDYFGFLKNIKKDIAKKLLNNEITVDLCTGAEFLPKYRYGVGLIIYINKKTLDAEDLISAMNCFLNNGEEKYLISIENKKEMIEDFLNNIDLNYIF